MVKVTVYTIANSTFFVGAAALVNSLRLNGYQGEIVLVDTGLTNRQRKVLTGQCRVVDPPRHRGPMKNGYRVAHDELAILIDSDIVVTAQLDSLLQRACDGSIVAFVDGWSERRFDEWEADFLLPGRPRKQPYVNSGFVAFSTSQWPDLMEWWTEASSRAMAAKPRYAYIQDDSTDPYAFNDQDSLNAVLMTYVERNSLAALDPRLAPIRKDMDSVHVTDVGALTCVNDGERTMLLHCSNRPKPWEPRGWMLRPYAAYVDLLLRLLFAEDLALRIDPGDVPVWLRPTRLGRASRATMDTTRRSWRAVKGALPPPARDWVYSTLTRLAGARR